MFDKEFENQLAVGRGQLAMGKLDQAKIYDCHSMVNSVVIRLYSQKLYFYEFDFYSIKDQCYEN